MHKALKSLALLDQPSDILCLLIALNPSDLDFRPAFVFAFLLNLFRRSTPSTANRQRTLKTYKLRQNFSITRTGVDSQLNAILVKIIDGRLEAVHEVLREHCRLQLLLQTQLGEYLRLCLQLLCGLLLARAVDSHRHLGEPVPDDHIDIAMGCQAWVEGSAKALQLDGKHIPRDRVYSITEAARCSADADWSTCITSATHDGRG
jgi:hypothetical protein